MDINDAFPSKYLKASDLQGATPTLTISHVTIEEVGKDKDRRPCIYFQGHEKGVVLNKTNATNIGNAYGPNTDNWIGKPVTLFTTWVDFQGQSVEAIRIRPANGGIGTGVQGKAPAAADAKQPDYFKGDPGFSDSDIPF